MNKLEELIAATKLGELIDKKEDEAQCKKVLWVLAIIGAIAAVAGIAYVVYRFFAPDYLEDFDDDDYSDSFDDDFIEFSDNKPEAED